MKSIVESGEVMGLYAQIDFCYYMLKEIQGQLNKPASPLERMIDDSCKNKNGESFSQVKMKEAQKAAISYMKTIIKCKKKIEADYSGDVEVLQELKAIPI